jgi:Na+/melibiose symporter-like transporter
MDWLRQQDPRVVRGVALVMFGLAFLLVYLANRTTTPVDVVLIVLAIAAGVTGFALWLMYGDMVDRGRRR